MSIAASIYFPVKDQIANAIEIRIVIIQNKRVNNVLKFFSKNFIVRHNMNPLKAIPIGKCTPLNSWMYAAIGKSHPSPRPSFVTDEC